MHNKSGHTMNLKDQVNEYLVLKNHVLRNHEHSRLDKSGKITNIGESRSADVLNSRL